MTECKRFADVGRNENILAEFWAHGPGAFFWTERGDWEGRAICIVLPRVGTIVLPVLRGAAAGSTQTGIHVWGWDGDVNCPTLRPSIDARGSGDSRWHGFLKAGCLQEC